MSTPQATVMIALLILALAGICLYVSRSERDLDALADRVDHDAQANADTMLTVRWPDEYGNHWHASVHPNELTDLIREQPLLALAIKSSTARVSIHPTTEGAIQ